MPFLQPVTQAEFQPAPPAASLSVASLASPSSRVEDSRIVQEAKCSGCVLSLLICYQLILIIVQYAELGRLSKITPQVGENDSQVGLNEFSGSFTRCIPPKKRASPAPRCPSTGF